MAKQYNKTNRRNNLVSLKFSDKELELLDWMVTKRKFKYPNQGRSDVIMTALKYANGEANFN